MSANEVLLTAEPTLDYQNNEGVKLPQDTQPLIVENKPSIQPEERKQSLELVKESPSIQKLMRSPVVEDTLSDIEEALSEIRTTPRPTGGKKEKRHTSLIEVPNEETMTRAADFDDSASDYSRSAIGNESTLSLVHSPAYRHNSTFGNDGFQNTSDQALEYSHQFATASSSESEQEQEYTLDEVRSWTPAQVSAYFQEQHIPLNTCDKFEEQEITGSILLQLEMAHLKELEISSFGKRFEVWKEIEKLKEMVGLPASSQLSPTRTSSGDLDKGKQPRNRSSSTPGGVLPRLPSLHNRAPSKTRALTVPRSHPEDLNEISGI